MTDHLGRGDVTPTERVAIVVRDLAHGQQLTPRQVSELTACDLRTAYRVLERISRVLPLYEDAGQWALMDVRIE